MHCRGPKRNPLADTIGQISQQSSDEIEDIFRLLSSQRSAKLIDFIKSYTGPVARSARAYSLGNTTRRVASGKPSEEYVVGRAPAFDNSKRCKLSIDRTESVRKSKGLILCASVE